MDDQIMWLMELSCCWTSDPNVAMFPKESRLSPDEARYIVQQFDYVWGTYTGDTDSTHIISDVESKSRAAVAASSCRHFVIASRLLSTRALQRHRQAF